MTSASEHHTTGEREWTAAAKAIGYLFSDAYSL